MATTGNNPWLARPAANVTACSSAMPTSKKRPGWRCLKKFRPVPYFMAAVMPHSRGSSSPKSASAQPNVDEKESFGDSSGSVRWFKSMDDTAWNSPGFSSAGFRPLPFLVTTCRKTGAYCSPRRFVSVWVSMPTSWPSMGPIYWKPISSNIVDL